MKIYYINESYIDYLRNYDSKVPENKNSTRPYIGVVLEINEMKYYAPLTSPKPKHKTLKNSVDFRKIDGGKYGAINFNNMIPVKDDAVQLVDISSIADIQYKKLLTNQIMQLKIDKQNILNTAFKLYNLLTKDDSALTDYERRVKSRCCNISLLESVCNDF
ncbi:type III toxin-antitoxin system ToxN/AbiQ family toxin [Aerococcaceae bacterium NML160702]|nr:type III toxin-antitoxin system ToxN/AbiQ family toxin [Aerococcaceae bacterium NML160702]